MDEKTVSQEALKRYLAIRRAVKVCRGSGELWVQGDMTGKVADGAGVYMMTGNGTYVNNPEPTSVANALCIKHNS